jgi:hypothetical protein
MLRGASHCATWNSFTNLQLRTGCSHKGISWATKETFATDDDVYARDFLVNLDKMHSDANMYYLAIKELSELGLHKDIIIEDEISQHALERYDYHLHENVFPPQDRDSVRVVFGDGHMKVLAKCKGGGQVRAGRPRKSGKNKGGHSNGRFMMVDPRTGRILNVTQQIQPENNNNVVGALEMVAERYKGVSCFIYDKNCGLHQFARTRPNLHKVKYYIIDKCHGSKHVKTCSCAPQNHRSLARRVRGLNTSVAEQTLSWFRTYARHLNEMRAVRNKFLVLYYTKRHNEFHGKGESEYLNPRNHLSFKRYQKSYTCTRKRPAGVCKKPASA